MSVKLVGYRFSPTIQEVLHVVKLLKATVELQNADWDEEEALKPLLQKSPNGTLPLFETSEGVLS